MLGYASLKGLPWCNIWSTVSISTQMHGWCTTFTRDSDSWITSTWVNSEHCYFWPCGTVGTQDTTLLFSMSFWSSISKRVSSQWWQTVQQCRSSMKIHQWEECFGSWAKCMCQLPCPTAFCHLPYWPYPGSSLYLRLLMAWSMFSLELGQSGHL